MLIYIIGDILISKLTEKKCLTQGQGRENFRGKKTIPYIWQITVSLNSAFWKAAR